MKNFKLKILEWFSGKFGKIIIPLVAGFVGTVVGTFYSWLTHFLSQWPSVYQFFSDVWVSLDTSTQAMLSPTAIGTASGVIIYAIVQELLNHYFVGEIEKDQKAINKVLPPDEHLVIDGFKGPKTKAAQAKVLDMAKNS